MRELHLVSAPFACGVAWLVNVLLELDIRTTHVSARDPEYDWLPKGRAVELRAAKRDALLWHLPVLHERREFVFEPDVEVFWEHRLDFARRADRPVLLFVRDPRDAIFSFYRRHQGGIEGYETYLRRPETWPDHFPGLFHLPPAETWAYYHLFWLGQRRVTPVHVVGFEAMRAAPVETVERILRLLEVTRSRARILEALERSTFDRARAAMERTAQRTGTRFMTACKGRANEWPHVYTPALLRVFNGPVLNAMRALQYAPAEDMPIEEAVYDGRVADLMENRRACAALDEAMTCSREDRLGEAWALLETAVRLHGGEPRTLTALACAVAALDWTERVFTPGLVASPQGQAAFDTFFHLNLRFHPWLPVRRALTTVLAERWPCATPASGVHAEMRDEPLIIAEDLDGYFVFACNEQYFALAHGLRGMDLSALSETEVNDLMNTRRLLIADTLDALRRLIGATLAAVPSA